METTDSPRSPEFYLATPGWLWDGVFSVHSLYHFRRKRYACLTTCEALKALFTCVLPSLVKNPKDKKTDVEKDFREKIAMWLVLFT